MRPNLKVEFSDGGMATVTSTSLFTGKIHTRILKLNKTQYENWALKGMLIQDAMPHLSADEREFFLTGATPEEWKDEFGDED